MTLLAIGVAATIAFHLMPYYAIGFRDGMIAKLGKGAYRGVFSLFSLGSFAAIVFGWRTAEPMLVYDAPAWGMHVTPLFVLVAFVLFFSSRAPTNIRRVVRHPQMTGLLVWAIGHLISNGEDRSLILFGGFALWAVLAIVGANRRDKVWEKPDKEPFIKDIITVLIGTTVFAVFMYFHEAIIGVSPFA